MNPPHKPPNPPTAFGHPPANSEVVQPPPPVVGPPGNAIPSQQPHHLPLGVPSAGGQPADGREPFVAAQPPVAPQNGTGLKPPGPPPPGPPAPAPVFARSSSQGSGVGQRHQLPPQPGPPRPSGPFEKAAAAAPPGVPSMNRPGFDRNLNPGNASQLGQGPPPPRPGMPPQPERLLPGGGPSQMHPGLPQQGAPIPPPQQGGAPVGPGPYRNPPPQPSTAQSAAPANRGPAQHVPLGPPGGMRELRVEDALIYLDDVKREFGDRPRIYNEFLEIMKNFKSQAVDTPGVINRVSSLFRGYNNLILGFNKFLPDGYKISLEDLQRQDAELKHQQAIAEGRTESGFQFGRGQPGQGPPHQQHNREQVQGMAEVASEANRSPGVPMHSRVPMGQQPQKGPAIGAQPPQVKAVPPGPGQRFGAQQGQQPGGPPRNMQPQPSQVGSNGGAQGMNSQPGGHRGGQQGIPQPPAMQQAPAQPQHQAVEFDHAISYVTNIKKRFADDPGTYHKFLEILHTYQKEQRGIKEVLEQVAALFADHPDLLKEFTFFLPDAVQEQAKERLHRAAAESETRQALAAQQRMQQHNWSSRGNQNRSGGPQFIDMTGQQMDTTENSAQQSPSRERPFSAGRENNDAIVPIQHPQPETFVYNSAVERQFFEAAKEALTAYSRDGGQAWAEFLKCLDMYAQELLSKSEMLSFVEPLLGKRNTELFEEFKRILTAAGSPSGPHPSIEDSWYSVPLAEIDFFRCRQCSPSYRALPRDYPAPPSSERSEEERKNLNDIWVSLPKGSEESYTFRHMRRNQYEETLFRVEDERFEIDMCIDSNAATLRRLEPIAEEIFQLAQEEQLVSDFSASSSKPEQGEAGMGGLRFQYTFDPSILTVIHRNSITRIYGDAGQEMLDLMVKNPTVTIPIVVHRLRQKDVEWRNAREKLNRHWKDLAQTNYYKSLDHRSLTWRTTDKRATSNRTLLSEIKDRSLNGGKESEASLSARRDKAKEEHGAFYLVTKAHTLAKRLDLDTLPKPDPSIFTPHHSLMYENNSWVQRDAYRILTFALERGNTSPADKERCHGLWRDFLGPMFGLSLEWMQRPAIAYQESTTSPAAQTSSTPVIPTPSNDENMTEEEDSSAADEGELGKNVVTEELNDTKKADKSRFLDYHPLPAGTSVSTIYGEGKVVRFRPSDKIYEVELLFGATGFVSMSAVLCSVQQVEKSSYTNQLWNDDKSKLERSDDILCIGPQSLYLFFRLHQILIRRLNIAKEMAYKVSRDPSLATLIEQMTWEPNEDIGKKRYEAYLSLVYSLIEGSHSNDAGGKYEDRVRTLLGHGAWELATMDKLVSHILKNLQGMAHDEVMMGLVALYRRHREKGFRPDAFRQEAALLSEGESMYAFQLCQVPGTDKKVLHMELLGVILEDDERSQTMEEPEDPPPAKRQRR